jgi:hypothetical protein
MTGNGSLSHFDPSEINPLFYYLSPLFFQDALEQFRSFSFASYLIELFFPKPR